MAADAGLPPGPPGVPSLSAAGSHAAHVTTFYSFKGGVGRSLLLANAGWSLAERRRILLWDLDLEAPGLHRIPALSPPEVKLGFLEWLGSFEVSAAFREHGALPIRDAAALSRLVLPVPGRQNLSILPAFGDGADFARLYAEGPWRELVVREPALGLSVFRAALTLLAEKHDHILIDSRTGITDIGGLLAALLPHATVLVGGYGHQSLHGLLHVRNALDEAVKGRLAPRRSLGAGEKLQIVYVVSPVPEDVEQSAERRRVWSEVFGELRPLEIPFDRRLLWSERLLAHEDPQSDTARAYLLLAERLSGLRDQLLARAERLSEASARYPDTGTLEPRLRAHQGSTFEERIRRLLELHGYSVELQQHIAGHEVDLVARVTGGLDEQCWWVECKDHRAPVGKEVFERLASLIRGEEGRSQGVRGMVVARAFTAAATSFAADHSDLKAWTIDDLESRLFDPRPYLHALVSAFEKSTLARTYVAQQAQFMDRPAAKVDLLENALKWAAGEGPHLWLLVGDDGTGKSAFFHRLAYELARRALVDSETPFPLAISLGEVPTAPSVETLLFEHLRRRLPGIGVDPAVLLHLLAAGRCVLLLDAFDEMGMGTASRSWEERFREIARVSLEEALDPRSGNRVLITCRTQFVRTYLQHKETASSGSLGRSTTGAPALARLAERFNAAVGELCTWEKRQIGEFLRNHLEKARAHQTQEFIARTPALSDLAGRPMLLDLVVKVLPSLREKVKNKVTAADLYEEYTRQWLEGGTGKERQISPIHRQRLLTLLASGIWRREDRQIHSREFLGEVKRLSGFLPGQDYNQVDVELRTASFLHRSSDGYYRFSHKSFLEYFLAQALCDAITDSSEAARALDLPHLSLEVMEFFWHLPATDPAQRLAVLREVQRSSYSSQAQANAVSLVVEGLRRGVASSAGEKARPRRADSGHLTLRGLELNGVHARTGRSLGPAYTVEALVELAEREQGSPMQTGPLALANLGRAGVRRHYSLSFDDLDLSEPSQAGWGVIFSSKADPRIREALRPLLAHRKEQVTRSDEHRYHEFTGGQGFQTGDTKATFLRRHHVGPGEFDPVRVPYYLMLVGGPEEIPFGFQGKLDGRYAVGRLSFDRLEDYARYAAQVVATEKAAKPHPLRATVFGVANADDRAMELTCEFLAKRVATNLAAKAKSYEVDKVLGVAATKDRLRRLLGGDQTPDLLFTACHGMGFDAGDPRQEAEQGSLVCADWPGPLAWQRPLDESHYFTAGDVGDEARVSGLIIFHFACHSTGTPAYDSYPDRVNGKPRCLARKPFVAALAKRLLGHPAGGALAVVGHVERTWGYSFSLKGVGPITQAFEQALRSMLAGQPVGLAMEPFARRAFDLADDLHSESWDTRVSREEAQSVAMLWTALQDARNYLVLGDPAVRLSGPPSAPTEAAGPAVAHIRRKIRFEGV